MTEEARRRLAYAIARMSGRQSSSIYSYHTGSHVSMSGSPTSYYDYQSGSYFTNNYDYETGFHWSFTVSESAFTGYNYGSGDHFSGSIKGGAIAFFDYGTGAWYNYTA